MVSAANNVIQTPSPRAAGEVENCTAWYHMETFSTCEDILVLFGLTLEEFYTFNPSVGSSCTSMAAGSYYCVSTNADGTAPGGYVDPVTTTSSSAVSTTTGISTPSPIQVCSRSGSRRVISMLDGANLTIDWNGVKL